MAQHALLLDRRRLGVALGDNQAAQYGAVFTGNLLPDLPPVKVAEADLALGIAVRQENAPAIVGHAHEAVGSPALRVHRGRGAQINVGDLEVARAKLLPPIQEFRLPVLESALQRAVRAEVNVVRNAVLIIDRHEGKLPSELNGEQ